MKTVNEICDELYEIVGYNDGIRIILQLWGESIVDKAAEIVDDSIGEELGKVHPLAKQILDLRNNL